MGPELMQLMKEQAVRFATEIVSERVDTLKQIEGGFQLEANGKTYHARTVILSTGATARRLGLESEKALYGRGVSACATCDGFFFKGKNVMIVGGGDSAMEEANFLTRFATSVTIVHRRDAFRASKIMQDRTLNNPKISVLWNSEITEIKGVDVGKVVGVVLRDTKTGEIKEQAIDGVFAAIGHDPNVELVKDLLIWMKKAT
jgi:thioredoxin reductase (NADPH)